MTEENCAEAQEPDQSKGKYIALPEHTFTLRIQDLEIVGCKRESLADIPGLVIWRGLIIKRQRKFEPATVITVDTGSTFETILGPFLGTVNGQPILSASRNVCDALELVAAQWIPRQRLEALWDRARICRGEEPQYGHDHGEKSEPPPTWLMASLRQILGPAEGGEE